MLSELSTMSKPILTEGVLERLVFGSGLVFNQTWEDPEVDLQALALGGGDVVLAIASAGDNVLTYALAGLKKIYAVDFNPAQIYLLNLKIAAAQYLDYADFWHLFSLAPAPRANSIYADTLRRHLDEATRRFWDDQLGLVRAGLGRAGVFGRTLWLLRTYLRVVCGPRALAQVFECESLAEQADFYFRRVHSRWWNPLARPFAEQLPILLLFGAHPHQARRVRGQQFARFLAAGIRRALSTLPAGNNYFWQQVLLGRYLTPPLYLRPENFARLKEPCLASSRTSGGQRCSCASCRRRRSPASICSTRRTGCQQRRQASGGMFCRRPPPRRPGFYSVPSIPVIVCSTPF